MADFDSDLDDVEMSNVIGLLMTIKQIREQKPLDDPNALGIDEKGKPYYRAIFFFGKSLKSPGSSLDAFVVYITNRHRF